jgi:hypothetical protein
MPRTLTPPPTLWGTVPPDVVTLKSQFLTRATDATQYSATPHRINIPSTQFTATPYQATPAATQSQPTQHTARVSPNRAPRKPPSGLQLSVSLPC